MTDEPGVWVNAYHGTSAFNMEGILQKGLKIGGTNGIVIATG